MGVMADASSKLVDVPARIAFITKLLFRRSQRIEYTESSSPCSITFDRTARRKSHSSHPPHAATIRAQLWSLSEEDFESVRQMLFRAVYCIPEDLDESLRPSHDWLQKHLNARINNALSMGNDEMAKTVACAVTAHIAEIIRDRPDSSSDSIARIVQDNHEAPDLEKIPHLFEQGSYELKRHFVFRIVGWISGLYDPVSDQDFRFFKLTNDGSISRQPCLLHKPAFETLRVSSSKDVSLVQLLTEFGDVFPNWASLLVEQDLLNFDSESLCTINMAFVTFHQLSRILRVKLRWTYAMNQHLEYDRRRNVLHIFAAPSICALSLNCDDSVQQRLFDHYRNRKDNSDPVYPCTDMKIFMAEILLSYRLLFGWHRRSRSEFQRQLAMPDKIEGGREGEMDPLLIALCTKKVFSQEITTLFAQLGVEGVAPYMPLSGFQFLGKRLLRLEQHCKIQNASPLRKLWYCRYDSPVLWATLATVLLAVLQLVFGIHQVFFQVVGVVLDKPKL